MYMYDHIDLRGYIRRNVTNPQSACFEQIIAITRSIILVHNVKFCQWA